MVVQDGTGAVIGMLWHGTCGTYNGLKEGEVRRGEKEEEKEVRRDEVEKVRMR